jgi:hypothetical protein
MEARPHPLIERFIAALIPPLARESVLGDLAERYRGSLPYLREAFAVLPLVIFGQIRRTTTFAAFALQALVIFGCMGGFGDMTETARDVPLWARAAVLVFFAMLTLVLRDAYRGVDGWSAGRALRDILAVSAVVAVCQLIAAALAAAGVVSPQWIFGPQRAVVIVIAALPTLFVFRLGLGLDGDSRLQEPPGALSAAELRADYERFKTRVRTRNLLEVSIYGLGAATGALFLIFAQGLTHTTVGWCWVGGQCVVSWYLLTKGSADPMPEPAPFAHLAARYRAEIARQRRLVRVIWWWYLWPLCIGAGLPSIARASDNLAFGALGLACIALAIGLVAWFTQSRAQDFKEEMDILDTVRERP